MTPEEVRALLEQEADIRARRTSYKDLATKTGLTEQYIANVVSRLIRQRNRPTAGQCEQSIKRSE